MRVRFLDTYDYRPSGEPRVAVRYRPDGGPANDGVYTVKRECGLRAKKAGKAEVLAAPKRISDAGRG